MSQRKYRENYDPAQPVCQNQADFNQAFREALKFNAKENMKEAKPWVYVYLALWVIFFVWAVMLAQQVPAGPARTLHMLFAVLCGPVYVLAYYLGMLGK